MPLTVCEVWSIFHTKYTHLLNKYVLTQCCSGSRVTEQWMNTLVLSAISRKCKAWYKFQAISVIHMLWITYTVDVGMSVPRTKCDFEQDIANYVANNPKKFGSEVVG